MSIKQDEVLAKAYGLMEECRVCPRRCGVNRLEDEIGYCGIGKDMLVSSAGPHFGEESVLVGRGGSGTIFFAGCNLLCVFCQNYDISHLRQGKATTPEELARIMLYLKGRGCHNINFVTPTHITPQIMEGIKIAREAGLKGPTVYNCGGYESVETLRLLEGLIQIYMPDFKYSEEAPAKRYSNAPDYPEVCKAALKEMHRQVGDLQITDGLAVRGLLVRHLVLPNDQAGSKGVIDFLAEEISPNTFINVMNQYRPMYKALAHPDIDRYPTGPEFMQVYDYAKEKGLRLAD
jgi:putative pyruvate formate lyase activating enzyme